MFISNNLIEKITEKHPLVFIKKLGKYNTLLEQFSGNEKELMDWAKKEAEKETLAYNQQKEKVSLSLSPLARIPLDEERVFNIGYLFLQKICSELRMDNICRNIRNHHKFRMISKQFSQI